MKEVENTGRYAGKIAQAMEEQLLGSSQIQTATEQVTEIAQNVSSDARGLSERTEELRSMASSLNDIIMTFKARKD